MNVQEFLISHYSKLQMYFGMGLVEFTLPRTLQKAYYGLFHLSDDNRSPNT
jgi:hypothetical protein